MSTIQDTNVTGTQAAQKEQDDARQLDTDIRESLRAVQGGTKQLFEKIAQAKETPNFLGLVTDSDGKPFADWQGYIIDVMSSWPDMHASIRAGFSQLLTDEGMSLRQAAAALKISHVQVAKDLRKLAGEAAAAAKAEAKAGAPEGKPQRSHVMTAGQRLYKALDAAVTDETIADGKKFTLADLNQLHAELARVSDLVTMQLRKLTVDAKVEAMLADQADKLRAEVEASLVFGVAAELNKAVASSKRQGTQSRTGQVA